MTRNLVLPLTDEQIVARALYLARVAPISSLDSYVRRPAGAADDTKCQDIFYLLKEHNGGKDPTAPDPADRWSRQGETFINRTCDCIGGACWCAGFDRWQPIRFAHVPGYDGWINTDSMIWEARHAGRCFAASSEPKPGWFIVCESGTLHHVIGHIGVIIGYALPSWDPADHRCWAAIRVVNVAAYKTPVGAPGVANQVTTGAGWFGTGAMFLRSKMTA